jgi:tetratricopeptide (TPR) repeat protein
MKKAILHAISLALLILCCTFSFAQESEVDSLHRAIDRAKTDTAKIDAFDNLAWKLMFRNPDTALIIGQNSLSIAKKITDSNRIQKAYNSIATAYAVKGDYTPSLKNFYQAREIARRINAKKDLSRILNNIGLVYWNQGKLDSAIEVYNQAILQFQDIGNQESMASTLNNLGLIYQNKGDFDLAIESYRKSIQIFDSLEIKNRALANANNNLGIVYFEKGNLPTAMEQYLKALKVYESINDLSDSYANVLSNIGNIYKEQEDFERALEYYTQSKEVSKKISEQSIALANTLNNIGSLYIKQNKDSLAILAFKEALQIQKSLGEKTTGTTVSLTNLGRLMKNAKNLDKAEEFFQKALQIQKEIGDKKGIAATLHYLGGIELEKEKPLNSIELCKESFELSSNLGLLEAKKNACDCLSEAYGKLNNTSKAYKYYKLFIQSRDSITNQENTKEVTRKAMRYEFDKIQYQDSLQRAEEAKRRELEQREKDLKKEAEIQRQRIYSVSGGIGFLLMLGLAFVLFKGYKNKQKANEIISAKKAEVEQQKEAVEEQKEIIEEKNREIVDSINYAKRIQNTLLPSTEAINKRIGEHFVFFRPKDIVSGDFYWVDFKEGYDYFSTIDCTGHGVPGALVSVIGHNGLNRVLNEYKILEPAAILDKLNDVVEESFTKTSGSIKDGMDLALCRLNKKNMKVDFAGANNPLYLIRKGEKKDEKLAALSDRIQEDGDTILYEIKADKQPIGKFDFRHPFKSVHIDVKKGDCLYIFTDGYADQFGGSKGKKLMYKPFKNLLLSLSGLPMQDQLSRLNKHFDQWRAGNDQVDDVCVMGVRI